LKIKDGRKANAREALSRTPVRYFAGNQKLAAGKHEKSEIANHAECNGDCGCPHGVEIQRRIIPFFFPKL
jgi:hypothetical protein